MASTVLYKAGLISCTYSNFTFYVNIEDAKKDILNRFNNLKKTEHIKQYEQEFLDDLEKSVDDFDWSVPYVEHIGLAIRKQLFNFELKPNDKIYELAISGDELNNERYYFKSREEFDLKLLEIINKYNLTNNPLYPGGPVSSMPWFKIKQGDYIFTYHTQYDVK